MVSRAGEVRILCYHDVVATDEEAERIPFAVSAPRLARHFGWFRARGWEVVSVDQVVASRNGGAPLPPRALVLSFDDGYRSHYERVFPLLKAFHYPALFAVVGSWMDLPEGSPVPYDNGTYRRGDFLAWDQLQEMAASPLVEIASHSFDYHRGLLANPQGNRIQAFIARQWDPGKALYETESERSQRMEDDLRASWQRLEKQLGRSPRCLVWPFGRYNNAAIEVARKVGFRVMFNLDSGANDQRTPLDHLRRTLIAGNPDEVGIEAELHPLPARPFRAMHVDLDYVYDTNPRQQERNLDVLVERVSRSGANAVFLQAFADPEGNGTARALYFPNRHLPMRADLFSRVAWQLHTRTGAAVYAWMPVLSFALPTTHPAAAHVVESSHPLPGAYRRLTPFSKEARQAIAEIYDDLASHCTFEGLLFHDDATFSRDEDESVLARAAWAQAKSGFKGDRSRFQEQALTEFTLELAKRVRAWQPELKTARNLYAAPVMDKNGPARFAQSMGGFLASYDRVALMAFPFMEGADKPLPWLEALVAKVRSAGPEALSRTVFELQTKDWRTGKAVESALLARQMEVLVKQGAIHLAFYPDDFPRQHPDLEAIAPWFSLRRTPGGVAGR